jgi:hypothetical protein
MLVSRTLVARSGGVIAKTGIIRTQPLPAREEDAFWQVPLAKRWDRTYKTNTTYLEDAFGQVPLGKRDLPGQLHGSSTVPDHSSYFL